MRSLLHKKVKNIRTLALIGAPILGLVSSIILSYISEYTGLRAEGLDTFKDAIVGMSGYDLLILVAVVGIVVPIAEEIVFRGVLWKVFSFFRSPEILTYIVISILFAAAHYEPLHILGVLPLSFFIGWLRMKTKSIMPGIIAHMSNNLVACFLLLL